MASPIPTTHCKECGTDLFVDGKKLLKGSTCMKCHAKKGDERRLKKRRVAIAHLGDRCMDCGKQFPDACYDFHHNRDKEECVSILIRNNVKLETILEEASKCDLVCANCHRIRHYK